MDSSQIQQTTVFFGNIDPSLKEHMDEVLEVVTVPLTIECRSANSLPLQKGEMFTSDADP